MKDLDENGWRTEEPKAAYMTMPYINIPVSNWKRCQTNMLAEYTVEVVSLSRNMNVIVIKLSAMQTNTCKNLSLFPLDCGKRILQRLSHVFSKTQNFIKQIEPS